MNTDLMALISKRLGNGRGEYNEMRLEITQDMLDRGIPNDCYDCPVVLAFRAVNPDADLIRVDSDGIEWWDPDDFRFCALCITPELLDFINRFDAGDPVTPRSFDLPVTL